MDTIPKLNICMKEEMGYRENFKRDYKFSCPVLDDTDIFKKSLQIADLTQEWEDYYEMCIKIPNFDEYRKNLRNMIIQKISSIPGYSSLETTINQNKIYNNNKHTGPKTYLREILIGKRMLSVDLIKGNYQSMKYINSEYVFNSNTYDEMIGMFTTHEPIKRSKMFRQMIFGLLNPNVQGMVQRKMIDDIITEIYKNIKEKYEICFLSNDEVIFVINNDEDKAKIEMITKNMKKYQTRVTEFSIEKIPNGYGEAWYVKHYKGDNEKKRIMGVHTRYLMQVYNHVMGIKNNAKDYLWRESGRLCMILEPETF